jgi:hypothetical protein
MEHKKNCKITFWSLLKAKLFKYSSYKSELENMKSYFDKLENTKVIETYKITKDQPQKSFDQKLKRHIIVLTFPNNKNITCTGVDYDSHKSLIKAMSEAAERILFLDNQLDNVYSFKDGSFSDNKISPQNTNGTAFHSNFCECFFNSFYELIERHFVLAHWYTKTPPLKEIDLLGNAQYADISQYFLNNNSTLKVVLLNQIGPVKILAAIVLCHDETNDFHVITSFSAHHNINTAMNKLFQELLMDFLSKPKTKINKAYSNIDDVTELHDHVLYYQRSDRIKHFDFLTKQNLSKIIISDLLVNEIHALWSVVKLAMKLDLKLWIGSPEDPLCDFYFLRAASSNLLELKFGRKHADLDVNLLKEFNSNIDLSLPHPIA